jgi:hypothetical protein
MKTLPIVLFVGVALGVSICQAQGTLEFRATLTGANEVPPNESPFVATGTFTLRGDAFSYDVSMYGYYLYPAVATINGPAPPNKAAPVLFTLAPFGRVTPDPGSGALDGVWTADWMTLTESQKADLLAGLWYVEWASAEWPEWNVRGQILLVPEPATWALLGLGAAVLLVQRHRRG